MPLDSTDARAFLQRRVALFAKVFAVLTLGFFVLGTVTDTRTRMVATPRYGDFLGWLQLVTVAGFGAVWFRARGGQRSERELRLLDATAAVLPTILTISALWAAGAHLKPERLGLIATAHLLMMRAVIVPSSPVRTLVIGLIVASPFVVATQVYYVIAARPDLPPPLLHTLTAGAWATVSIVLSTLASHTIFGLRERVREATKLGQYTLEQKIGEGGMGVVYRARHAMLRRPTAIKLLPPERAGEQALARFEREVQLTSLLTHPNTIAIYDYGRTPDGVFYYAMEFLDGIDLEELVARDGPQSPGCVARVLEQMAGALAEAHAAALIHRDIKPANVILCERGGVPGVAKVVDFGLVKHLPTDGPTSPALSTVNTILGTPLYSSPEAITNPDWVDARSDLYAVGAVGYYLLTGQHVFEGSTAVEVYGHHVHTPPVPPSERLGRTVPSDLQDIVLSCLEKDPSLRPQSADTLCERLLDVESRDDWTAEMAAEWWKRVRAAAASRFPGSRARETGGSRTLAVEWAGRVE